MTDRDACPRAEIPRSKTAAGENFPVGSFLLTPSSRAPVKLYYDFARYCDDIADAPNLGAEQKLRCLDRMGSALEGLEEPCGDADPARRAARLGVCLRERGIPLDAAGDLLIAFKADATKTRYANWGELSDYCRYSADPVGRFLLSLHGEDPAIYPHSDALCTSLQILNHLQDMKADMASLDRCYVPQDWLAQEGVGRADILAGKMSGGLRRVVDRMLIHVDDLNFQARRLVPGIRDRRMRLEAATIVNLALRLTRLLKRHDPLAGRVALTKADFIGAFAKACVRFGFLGRARS